MTKRAYSAVAVLGASTLFVFGAGSALATHFPPTLSCGFELNQVEAALVGATTFSGSNGEVNRTNLLTKLDAAGAKIGFGKYSDAIDKLLDISDNATALAGAAKPKLGAADATAINNAAANAMTCVGSLL